jgi:hypothetical protein
MNECGAIGMHISSYQDTLIISLHPSAFAIRFRHVAFGWHRKRSRRTAWNLEQINDLGLKCRT